MIDYENKFFKYLGIEKSLGTKWNIQVKIGGFIHLIPSFSKRKKNSVLSGENSKGHSIFTILPTTLIYKRVIDSDHNPKRVINKYMWKLKIMYSAINFLNFVALFETMFDRDVLENSCN